MLYATFEKYLEYDMYTLYLASSETVCFARMRVYKRVERNLERMEGQSARMYVCARVGTQRMLMIHYY